MTIAGKFIGWQAEQTTGNIIDVLSDTCRAVSGSNIVGIIGPALSREASIIAPFGEKIGIPVISYSATDPGLSNRNTYPTFYRTVSSDNAAALALVKLFIRFNWTSCTIIYQDDAFGYGGAKVISDAFNRSGLIVRQMVAFDIATFSIRVTMSVWYAFGNLIGYGVDFSTNTAAGRLLTAGLYILGLILVASYTANLASELTIAKSKDFISGIDDIKNGKIPFNRIGILVGAAEEEYYLREVSEGNKNYYPLTSRAHLYESLLAGIIDISFTDSGISEYATNNIYCNLTLIGNDFNKGAFGIVTPREWLYAQDLDVNILSLRESGDLENLRNKWFEVKNCLNSFEASTAIGIEAVSGLFLVFGVIIILSLVLFVWTKRHNIKNDLLIVPSILYLLRFNRRFTLFWLILQKEKQKFH
ncbi:unnamed protein product [Rotaria sp. Silwood1]|nr:unnamed protein product [Rotaria sp. Silwood1]